MPFLGWELSPTYEVALYTVLLLVLWLIIRLVASSMNTLLNYFREPSLEVHPFLNGVNYPVSYWTEKGKRPYQEDRFQILSSLTNGISLYGVFDGHGGSKAAQFCKEHLLTSLASDPEWSNSPQQTIVKCFYKVDADFSSKARANLFNDGTTAVIAAVDDKKVLVGNAGDSRAIIVQKGGKVHIMSVDHRPERKDEESRIRKLGGKLVHWGRWRVEGVLAVSRAIGDVELQPFITCEPEVIEKKIDPIQDEYVIIASDGLWDVMENEDVARFVIRHANKDFVNIAQKLCNEAMIMGSGDNVTVLVIDLKKRLTLQSWEQDVMNKANNSGNNNNAGSGTAGGRNNSNALHRQ